MRWLTWFLLVFLLSAGLRGWRLDTPPQPYFDEVYYVGAARNYLRGEADENNVHPPLAKQHMAFVLQQAGDSPGSWRLASLLASLGTLALCAGLALVLTGKPRVALLATTLLSLDFLHLVQSRVAMLDAIQGFWIMAAWVAVAWTATRPTGQSTLASEVLAGLCLGCATACKWNGLFALAGALLALLWLAPTRLPRATCLYVIGVALIYTLSYLPLMIREGFQPQIIVDQHLRMWNFRYDPQQFHHRYLSHFYTWPLGFRPVWYHFQEAGSQVSGIVALGCPLFWWFGVLLLGDSLFSSIRRSQSATRFLLAAFLPQWLLWALGTTGGFLYYMIHLVPLWAVLVARELDDWWEEPFSRKLALAYLLALALALALYYPLLTGLWVPYFYFRCLFFLPGLT